MGFQYIIASRIERYASHFCGITFPTKKEIYCVKSPDKHKNLRPTDIGKDQIIEKLIIFTNSHSFIVPKTEFQGNVVFIFSKFHLD